MPMGEQGMAEMQDMAAHGMTPPENTLPMMTGEGPFGPIEMGGMFTVVKVRRDVAPGDYTDPGWFEHPAGTVAYRVDGNGRRGLIVNQRGGRHANPGRAILVALAITLASGAAWAAGTHAGGHYSFGEPGKEATSPARSR